MLLHYCCFGQQERFQLGTVLAVAAIISVVCLIVPHQGYCLAEAADTGRGYFQKDPQRHHHHQLGFGWYQTKYDQKTVAPLGFLPVTRQAALVDGWHASDEAMPDGDEAASYIRSDMPSYRLVFDKQDDDDDKQDDKQDDNLISAVIVQLNAPLHEDTMEPLRAPGAKIVKDCRRPGSYGCWWMEYHVHFHDDGNVTVGELEIPPTWKAAEQAGWYEVGCVETMGGAHYLAPVHLMAEDAILQRVSFSPVYNKYTPGGGGVLTAFQFGGGTNATIDHATIDVSDVDNYGESVKIKDICLGIMCGETDCLRTQAKGEFSMSVVHLFLTGDIGVDLDTGRVEQVQCQGGRHVLCHESKCGACCGEGILPGEEFLYDGSLTRDSSPFQVSSTSSSSSESAATARGGKLGQHCYPDPAPPSDGSAMSFCIGTFSSMKFDIFDYDRYDQFFRDESTVTLSQAGMYKGIAAIREYVSFADQKSAYKRRTDTLADKTFYKDSNLEEGWCKFTSYLVVRSESDPSTAREATSLTAAMFEFTYDFQENYVSNGNVFYTEDYMSYVFNDVYNTDQTRDYICGVSEKYCPDTNVGMSRQECKDRLASLPIFSNGTKLSGNDYGCRVLHAYMASINQDHCAHISFEPQQDPYGRIKCQEPYDISPLDLFTQHDIDAFLEYLDSRQSLIEDTKGFKILYMPKEPSSKSRLIVLGGVVPVLIFIVAYLMTFRPPKKSPLDDDTMGKGTTADRAADSVNALVEKRNRQLATVLMLIPAILMVFGGFAALVLWLVQQNHPEWHSQDDGYRRGTDMHPLVDSYYGPPLKVGETDPQEQLSDDQFKVYVGFIIFGTCLIAGTGLELFVWLHFLQVWCASRERLWRFAQFIFPLMLVTALGLSARGSFLALPFLVFGLYKFGFPETTMYLYLGLYSPETMFNKVKDLILGIGFVVHHSAANMIVCMLVAQVIPSSRYVFNCTLPLVVQHWGALLAYHNYGLYVGVELVLEWYFEWIIFSNFAEIYNLHWTAALGAGVMVFAHWLFILGGLMETFGSKNKGSAESAEADDLHERGIRNMKNMMSEAQNMERRVRLSMRKPGAVIDHRLESSRLLMDRRSSLFDVIDDGASSNRASTRRGSSSMPMSASIANAVFVMRATEEFEALMPSIESLNNSDGPEQHVQNEQSEENPSESHH